MTKRFAYIIALLIAMTIGTIHSVRISDTYFTHEDVETKQLETIDVPPAYYMEYPAMMAPPEDSSVYEEPEEMPESRMEDNSDTDGWVPSDRALETKFWLDSIGSFLTTIAPFAVPFIMYRKKKKDESE